ncbi:MAG: hypothetical protein POELPBGB_03738 [Bacteroidia bacterium]|nr:hypothetical protein [Bacteroidia bacterium]
MKKLLLAFVIINYQLSIINCNAQVLINEFSCSNLDQFVDDHSDYGDWIELYNTTGSTVNLTGYYLSDDSLNNTKWQFPAGSTIAANAFMRIWASGRNTSSGGTHHTNFTLKQTKNNGEFVVFSNASGVIVDYHKTEPVTKVGHSYGRTTNGSSTWSIFNAPTPGASNNSSTPYTAYADKPDVDISAGFYTSAQTITLTTTETNSTIRYTLNGDEPTQSSALYTGPITISSTKILKAKTYTTNSGVLSSFIRFETYFINEVHTLPVVSVSGTQLTTLANGDNSLRPTGTFEFFNTAGLRTAKTYGEFNSHGQDSWANSQRSLDFVSRDEMGYNHSVEQQVFNTSPRNNYQRLILRAAGDDNYPADHNPSNAGSAHLRDAYIHNLSLQGGLSLDVRRGSKCVVYLNGAYWGVYDLRDNPDDHDNTEYYYGQDKYHLYFIETWGSTWAEYGGQAAFDDWHSVYDYIMNNDMSIENNYQYVADRYDVTSLTDYVLVNMFTVCSDWLNWNTAWWRGTDPNGTHQKWGYALWDNDATFGHYINYTGIPDISPNADVCDPEGLDNESDPEDHIGVLMKLRDNEGFNDYYISRQIDLWNTVFSCDNMLPKLDSTAALIEPEMTRHSTRWSGTYSEWTENVQQLRDFIDERCTALTTSWTDCYSLTGPYEITLQTQPDGAGTILFNSLNLNQFPWTGTYFGNVTSNLTATANSNFTFSHWETASGTVLSNNVTDLHVFTDFTTSDTITAVFTDNSIGINEQDIFDFKVYPTQTGDVVTVEYLITKPEKVNLQLFDVNGQLVFDNGTAENPAGRNRTSINLSAINLAQGIYYIRLQTEHHRAAGKVVFMPQ